MLRLPLRRAAVVLPPALLIACSPFTEAPPQPRVVLTPPADSAYVGAKVQFQARALDGRGAQMPNVLFTWTSEDTAVAQVDTAGAVRGRSPGMTQIVAAALGMSGRATVIVLAGPFTVQCAGRPAIRHTGTIAGETWHASAGLHMVVDTLTVADSLVIEAGAEVCTGPGAVLAFRQRARGSPLVLRALGSAAQPIRFTPGDGSNPRALIMGGTNADLDSLGRGPRIALSHVLAEQVGAAVSEGVVSLESSRFGYIVGGYRTGVTATETVLLNGVSVGPFSSGLTLRNSVVRNVACWRYGSVTLEHVRVEGSPGPGLYTGPSSQGQHCGWTLSGIRLVGNRTIASLDLRSAIELLSQPADSLRGNLTDTLTVDYVADLRGLDVTVPGFVHVVGPNGFLLDGPGTLRLEAGARLTVGREYGFDLPGVRLLAQGTASAPVRLTMVGPSALRRIYTTVGGSAALPSMVSHAEVSGVRLRADSAHTLLVDSSRFSDSASLALRAPGSRITGSVVQSAADSAAIILGGAGVELRQTVVQGVIRTSAAGGVGVRIDADNVVVDGCTISGAAGDGIRVTAGTGVRISHCNLAGNAGAGLNNLSPAAVDARNNWWGDPGGPTAVGAARALGDVQYTPWATAPFPIDTAPAYVSPAPAAASVTARPKGDRAPAVRAASPRRAVTAAARTP